MKISPTTTRRVTAAMLALGLAGGLAPAASAQNIGDAINAAGDAINVINDNMDSINLLSSMSSKAGTPSTPTTPATPTTPTTPTTPVTGTVRLTDQPLVASNNQYVDFQATLGGVTYENSIQKKNHSKMSPVEYALSNQFRTLDAVIGVSDLAKESDHKIVVKFIGDNNVIATHSVAFPDTKKISVNVTGVNRLRIEIYSYRNSTGAGASLSGGVVAYPTLTR